MASKELTVRRQHSPVRRFASAPARGLKALTRMVFGANAGLVWRFLPRSQFDYEREIGDGMQSSVLMAPILWMARTFPEAPLIVLDADGEEVERHPMVQKLRRPNPFYSGIALWMATLISWIIDGNGYWIKIGNQAGTGIAELWYAPHWTMQPKSDKPDVFITHYNYTVGGQVIRLETDEVVHFRYGLDPKNPRKGLSPIGSLLREIFTDDEAAAFTASLLRNLGIPGLIVSPEAGAGAPSPEDVQATKEYVDEEFAGDRRGKPLVMSGATKVQQFGFSPEQMQMREIRRIPEERVTAILGMPAVVVGLGAGLDRSTFANYKEAREAAYESNIIPSQRLFAEELRHQLLPDFEDQPEPFEVAFDLRQVRVLQDDRNNEAERVSRLYTAGVIVRAEARKAIGEEVTDNDNVYAVPITTVITPADEAGAPPRPTDDDTAKRRQARIKARQQDISDRLISQFAKDRDVLWPVFATELETDLDGLGRNAADAYERIEPKHRKAADTGDSTVVAEIVGALEIGDWKDKTLRARLQTQYLRTAGATVDTINLVTELGVMLPDPVQQKIIEAGGSRQGLIDIDEQVKDAIFRALADGREAGDGPVAIARRIRQYVPAGRFVNAGPKYRAELIARTETIVAQRLSSIAAYRATDTVKACEIRDGLLADSDAECEARDGDVVSFDDAESLALSEHPLGTLAFSPVVATAGDLEDA